IAVLRESEDQYYNGPRGLREHPPEPSDDALGAKIVEIDQRGHGLFSVSDWFSALHFDAWNAIAAASRPRPPDRCISARSSQRPGAIWKPARAAARGWGGSYTS